MVSPEPQGDVCKGLAVPGRGQPQTGEQSVLCKGHLVAGEALRLWHGTALRADVAVSHRYHDLSLPVQLPYPDRVAWGRSVLAHMDAGEDIRGMEGIMAWGVVGLQETAGDTSIANSCTRTEVDR